MALSILRNVLKCSRSFHERGPVFKAVANGTLIKTEPINKNLMDTCRCASLTIPQRRHFEHFSVINQHSRQKDLKKSKTKQSFSDSESDSDLDRPGHRGESDFWRKKIRTFHGILDVNKDGVISYDDFVLLADRFVSLGHLSPKHTLEFREILKDLWVKRWGEISPYNLVTVEQFLEDMHHVINDKRLVRRAHSFLPYLFKAVDKDHSGEISVEEFKLFYQCLGLKDEDAILAFRVIDTDADGVITLKEFVKHGRDFFLTEDENRISKYFFGPLVDH